MADTALARLLATSDRRPDALTAFALARGWYREGRRIEMQELAAELDVSRATLFRWVGSRDDLLGEILAADARLPLEVADREAGAAGLHGGARVAAAMERFCELVLGAEHFRAMLQREPERALRVLTTRAGAVQGRLVSAVEYLIQREVDAGYLDAPMPLPDLAYLVVRILESFLYSDLIIGETPDPAKVGQAVAVLLRS
jgi:AcrR family transcriptional regulator